MSFLRSILGQGLQARALLKLSPFDVSTPEGRSKERYRRVAITALSALAAKAVAAATMLISVPLAFSYLGKERFGLWATLSTVIMFLNLTDLGLGNALVNVIATSKGKGDRAMAVAAVSSTLFLLLAQAALILLVFTAVHRYVDWADVFNLHTVAAKEEGGLAMVTLVGIVVCQLPLTLVQRIQEGYQEGFLNNCWQIAGSLLGLGGLLLVMHMRLGLPWLVLAVAGAPVLVLIMNMAYMFSVAKPWLTPRLTAVSARTSGRLMRSGVTFFGLSLLTFLGIYSDNLIISRLLDASAVAEYAIVQRLSSIAHLVWAFIIPLWPAYGEAMARGEHEWVRRTFFRTLRVSIVAGSVIGIGLALFGPVIVRYWIGPELAIPPGLFYGFAAFIMLNGIIGSIAVILNSEGLIMRQLWILGVAAAISTGLKIALCVQYGASGVIWATVVAFGFFYVVPGVLMIRSALNSRIPVKVGGTF